MISVGSLVRGGVALIRERPRAVAVWVLLYLAVIAALLVGVRASLPEMIAYRQALMAASLNGAPPPVGFPRAFALSMLTGGLVFIVYLAVVFAAVVRAVAGQGDGRFAYLRLGMDELRLIGLGVILVLALFVAELVGVLLVALAAAVVGAVAGKAAAMAVAAALALVMVCALIYAEVRLQLAGPFTVLHHRIEIGPAWRASAGRFWTLFGTILLFGLALLVVGVAGLAISRPGLLDAYFTMDQQAVVAAGQTQVTPGLLGVGFAVQLVCGILNALIGLALRGALATAAVALDAPPLPRTPASDVPAGPWSAV